MMSEYPKLYPGKRWGIYYGDYAGVEQFALQEFQRGVQFYLPYVVAVRQASAVDARRQEHLALIGTPEDNPLIAELIAHGALSVPDQPQSYTIACQDSPWGNGNRLLVVAGADAAGVLYGVEELCAQLLFHETLLDGAEGLRKRLDEQADFMLSETPAITHRGIWTWGYVIYDYRRFLDNMARLKMNMLTIWNDQVPLNIREILDYAHARGIQVILGFHWGWGLEGVDLSVAADRQRIKEDVLATFREQYAGVGMDGIYFQTLTEHNTQIIAGRSVASWCGELVNDISSALLAENPNLSIQFGLHATSIRDHYTDLADLDDRVTITWEDAGGLPFNYGAQPDELDTYDNTLAYACRLAQFRPGTPFAMVPKGWSLLRWGSDFEHHGPFILGERHPEYVHERLRARQGEWDVMNERWFRYYPLAARFYREIIACRPAKTIVTGLVEDGLFEETIQPSVALLAEMLWNPHQSDTELLARAMRPFYRKGR
ncbi:MAG: beta-N-acetylhexosaminidase family protein [Armatimonadota bacterium]